MLRIHGDVAPSRSIWEIPVYVGEQNLTPKRVEGTIVWLALIAVLLGGSVYVWYSARRERRAGARDADVSPG